MISRTVLITFSLCLVLSPTLGEDSNDEAKRNGRASEGDITDLSKRIILDENNLPGVVQPNGKRCVEKLVNVVETQYDQTEECQHKLKKKCHITYVTDYHSAAEEKCETNFKKNCHISFKPVPHEEEVEICRTPYEKKCGTGFVGNETCRTFHETLCETLFKEYELDQEEADCETVEEIRCEKIPFEILHLPHEEGSRPYAEKERCEKWPVQKCEVNRKRSKKIHPNTHCKKIPRKVCAPNDCEIVPGPEICNKEKRTVISRVPHEECDIQPHKSCSTESALVPRLVPKKNCVKVPKEVCVHKRTNPKQITKPVKKNWCYDPEELKKDIQD